MPPALYNCTNCQQGTVKKRVKANQHRTTLLCWRHQRKVQETHKDLKKATRELRRTIEEKANTITDKDRTIAELENTIKERENQCAVWYKEERKTQERNKELKIQLKAEKEANQQKTNHIEEKESTESTLRKQLHNKRAQTKEQERVIQTITRERERLRRAKEKLQRETSNLRKTNHKLGEQLEKVEDKLKEIPVLQEKLKETQQQLLFEQRQQEVGTIVLEAATDSDIEEEDITDQPEDVK